MRLLLVLLLATLAPAQDRSQARSMVLSDRGIVATSQTLASQAGAQVLARGGSAIDAAIAANATLGVVDPDRVPRHRRSALHRCALPHRFDPCVAIRLPSRECAAGRTSSRAYVHRGDGASRSARLPAVLPARRCLGGGAPPGRGDNALDHGDRFLPVVASTPSRSDR